MITPVNYPEFRESTSKGWCVVEFWAEWCSPCRSMMDLVEDISSDFEGEISFFSVNVDDNSLLATEMRIGTVPTILLMRDGIITHRWQGLVSRENILLDIQRLSIPN